MKPTEQQIRSAQVTIGDLFDVLDRVSRKAGARAYGTTSPQVMAVRDATVAMCDGMKEELRTRVLEAFKASEGAPTPPCGSVSGAPACCADNLAGLTCDCAKNA